MTWRGSQIRPLLPLSAGILLLLVSASLALFLAARQQEATSSVRTTLVVEGLLGRIQTLITDAETAQRGFLLTGRLDYLEPYIIARREVGPELEKLGGELASKSLVGTPLTTLRRLLDDKLGELQKTIDLRQAGRPEDALKIVNGDSGARLMTGIRQAIDGMRADEERLLVSRSANAAFLRTIGQAVLLGSLLLVVAVGGFALIDSRRRLSALQVANSNLGAEVAERRAAEAQLRQLQKMEAVGQLTGGIAHDFNNMLAIVIGFLELARRRIGATNPEALKCVDSAAEGAGRAVVLTKRLLAFSRLQPLEPKVLELNRLVAGTSELLRRTIGESVRIETVLAGGLWNVYADAAQVESGIVNLAVNARDAMPEGGRLTIETGNASLDERYASEHAEVTPGQYVVLSVTDTGTGMAPSVIERAFDPFYTTKDVGKGSGLGLSQVFGFVKQSGGHLKIYSELGHGTTVKIYLPRNRGGAPSMREAVGSASLLNGDTEEVILVVEDEAKVCLMTVESLRELGYTVVHAASPEEALQRLASQSNVALLFTDIVMPGMNGRQLAEQALTRNPALKVLYTTGYTRNAVVHNGIVDEGTAFLPKPFTLGQLATKVRQTLDA